MVMFFSAPNQIAPDSAFPIPMTPSGIEPVTFRIIATKGQYYKKIIILCPAAMSQLLRLVSLGSKNIPYLFITNTLLWPF
jgi:hypothetical protein